MINLYIILIRIQDMRKAFFLSTVTGVISFFAGKYFYQQEAKTLTRQIELARQKRNFHSPHAVEQPFRLITYPHYNILYSTYHKSPLAVHEYLTKSLISGDAPRAKFFYPDQNIIQKHFQVDHSYFKDTEAYKLLKVNRGHMAAAGNYSSNQMEKFHTFAFTNIIPQNYYNNGGIWNTFERYTRILTQNPICESVEVISGPIYVKNTPYNTAENPQEKYQSKLNVLKENGIPIPQMLYKIIKCNSQERSYYNAFQFSNSQTYDNDKALIDFKVDLDKVQKQTGLHFNLQGGSLQEIDQAGLKRKKKELDYNFFFKLISKSTSLNEMNQRWRSAKQQKIEVNYNDFTDQIRQFLKAQISLLQGQDIPECQKLLKLLRLNKKVFYLYHLQKTKDIRIQKLQESYNKCLLKKAKNSEQQGQYELITKEMGNDFARFINK